MSDVALSALLRPELVDLDFLAVVGEVPDDAVELILGTAKNASRSRIAGLGKNSHRQSRFCANKQSSSVVAFSEAL